MTSDEKRVFFQCLFSVAWVDGEIGDQERGILKTLYDNVELVPEHREEVRGWFDEAPPEPDWRIPAGNPQMRRALVEQVFLVAMADQLVNAAEIELLERLRDRVCMSNDEFQELAVRVERALSSK